MRGGVGAGSAMGRDRGGIRRGEAGAEAGYDDTSGIPQAAAGEVQDAAMVSIQRCSAAQNRNRQDPEAGLAGDALVRQGLAGARMNGTWTQVYMPVGGSLGLSALVAAVPIFTLLVLLGVLRKLA